MHELTLVIRHTPTRFKVLFVYIIGITVNVDSATTSRLLDTASISCQTYS